MTNLTRALKQAQQEGFVVVGLDADGETDLYDLEAAVGPLVVVVGSEGRGLVPPRRPDLRPAGQHSDDLRGRVAQRLGGRGRDPGRGGTPPGGLTDRRSVIDAGLSVESLGSINSRRTAARSSGVSVGLAGHG